MASQGFAKGQASKSALQLCTLHLAQRTTPIRPFATAHQFLASESRLPAVATPSFWSSLVPKAFRSSNRAARDNESPRSKEWNPYTIFIVLGILVGGNAIQLIALRKEMLNFSRKTDAKLSLLREVVQRVKAGEEVDVAGLLGTGDPKQEQEWEEVMKELEETDMLEEGRKKRAAKREQRMLANLEAEDVKAREGARAREGGGRDSTEPALQAAAPKRPKFLM
ncbi:hypothetical protein MBLNU230_g2458t1 [Neophaeotheca triangularis]